MKVIVFSDNDILIKLAGCELLIPFCEAIESSNTDIFVTEAAQRAIPKQGNKKLTAPQSLEQLKVFMENTKTMQQALLQTEILDQLIETPNIDGGEAFLILAAYNDPNSKLATGDKRCLSSLLNTPSLHNIANSLNGRVYTLETAMLILIQKMGFDFVNQQVIKRCVVDGTLNLAFGESRSIEHATECLSSYCSELLPLLSDPHLIKKI